MSNKRDIRRAKIICLVLLSLGEITLFIFNPEIRMVASEELQTVDLIESLLPCGLVLFVNWIIIQFLFASLKFGYGLLLRLLWVRKNNLETVLSNCIKWLLSTNVNWGKSIDAKQRKVANTAEGLLTFYAYTKVSCEEIPNRCNDAQDYLIKQLDEAGFTSESIGTKTTITTAISSFALLKFKKYVSISPEQMEIITKIAQGFLSTNSIDGWCEVFRMQCQPSDTRYSPTLWALVFLNEAGYSNDSKFEAILKSIAEQSNKGLIGYTNSDSPKVTTTALLLSLITVLQNIDLQKQLLKDIDLNRVQDFLLDKICRKHAYIELEEFSGYRKYANKEYDYLTWTHTSIAYALFAISCIYEQGELTFYNKLRLIAVLRRILHENIYKADEILAFYQHEDVAQTKKDINVYPTMYLVISLCKFYTVMYSGYKTGIIDKALDKIVNIQKGG